LSLEISSSAPCTCIATALCAEFQCRSRFGTWVSQTAHHGSHATRHTSPITRLTSRLSSTRKCLRDRQHLSCS
jgi:hypothetical protein